MIIPIIIVLFLVSFPHPRPILGQTNCQIGLRSFSAKEQCLPPDPTPTPVTATYRTALYQCYDNYPGTVPAGNNSDCLTEDKLKALAETQCQNRSSCQPITLPSLKLINPNGGKVWYRHKTYTISWQADQLDNLTNLATTLYLYRLSDNQKIPVGAITYDAVTHPGINTYDWRITNRIPIASGQNNYQVEVILRDKANWGYAVYARDENDSPIIISSNPPPIASDANNDDLVNLIDFAIWKREYLLYQAHPSYAGAEDPRPWFADFDYNRQITIADFAIWKTEYLKNKS